jgi:hypothetical protein
MPLPLIIRTVSDYRGATDRTRSGSDPGTTFKVSRALYEANSESDADNTASHARDTSCARLPRLAVICSNGAQQTPHLPQLSSRTC